MRYDQVRRPVKFPVLTRSQADELEKLRQDYGDDMVIDMVYDPDGEASMDLRNIGIMPLFIALFAGYDIERTAEELIVDLYKLGHLKGDALGRQYQDGIVAAWRVLRKDEPFPYHGAVELNDKDDAEPSPESPKEL